jgi:Na+-driven multidrug efflux pump
LPFGCLLAFVFHFQGKVCLLPNPKKQCLPSPIRNFHRSITDRSDKKLFFIYIAQESESSCFLAVSMCVCFFKGLWLGLTLGAGVQWLSFLTITYFTDWKKEVKKRGRGDSGAGSSSS